MCTFLVPVQGSKTGHGGVGEPDLILVPRTGEALRVGGGAGAFHRKCRIARPTIQQWCLKRNTDGAYAPQAPCLSRVDGLLRWLSPPALPRFRLSRRRLTTYSSSGQLPTRIHLLCFEEP